MILKEFAGSVLTQKLKKQKMSVPLFFYLKLQLFRYKKT